MVSKGQRGQNTNFPAGVMPIHVGGGVLFGVSFVLCLLQRLLKGEARLYHSGQDIVRGAIEDADDLGQLVGRQTGGQGAEDGDTAPYAGLKEIAHSVLLGQLEQLIAVGGHQLLIGGDNALSRL